jgi:hypothetical protein
MRIGSSERQCLVISTPIGLLLVSAFLRRQSAFGPLSSVRINSREHGGGPL